MRAQIPANYTVCPRSIEDIGKETAVGLPLLQSFWDLGKKSESLIVSMVGAFSVEGREFRIPRFIFLGPRGGGDTIRLALFCALRGDEPEGAEALAAFFQELDKSPEAASGFHLYAYPLCNPGGLANRTRTNAAGRDLTEEFWSLSDQPEVYYLEREIGVHNFHGVISLHTTRSSSRFQVRSKSDVIEEALAWPAALATRKLVSNPAQVDLARDDSIPSGFLTNTTELHSLPFEINLGLPFVLPKTLRNTGTVEILRSFLGSYRTLLAVGQDL